MVDRGGQNVDEIIRRADAGYSSFADFSAWASIQMDDEVWQASLEGFAREKDQASPDTLQRTLEFARRAAAVDTGAIEDLYQVDRGFTFSVAARAGSWERDLAEKGSGVRRLFEAQLQGLELVVDAVTRRTAISEAWIRRLHETLCAPQESYRVRTAIGWQDQAFPKGTYKTHPNHVQLADGSVHSYCPVDLTGAEMHRLVAQLGGDAFAAAHPVLQAAYAHHALVVVHPFADGNGRVARALASTFTYRACSIPLVIYADQKMRYLDCLAAADEGRLERFATFVLQATVDTMNELVVRLREARAPSVREAAARLDGLYAPTEAPTAKELDEIAARVAGVVREEFARTLAGTQLPMAISHKVERGRAGPTKTPGFRPLQDGRASVTVTMVADAPAQACFAFAYQVLVARRPDEFYALGVERVGKSDDVLLLRLDLVSPTLTTAFRGQLDPWVQLRVSELLAELKQHVADTRSQWTRR